MGMSDFYFFYFLYCSIYRKKFIVPQFLPHFKVEEINMREKSKDVTCLLKLARNELNVWVRDIHQDISQFYIARQETF